MFFLFFSKSKKPRPWKSKRNGMLPITHIQAYGGMPFLKILNIIFNNYGNMSSFKWISRVIAHSRTSSLCLIAFPCTADVKLRVNQDEKAVPSMSHCLPLDGLFACAVRTWTPLCDWSALTRQQNRGPMERGRLPRPHPALSALLWLA